MVSWGFSPSDRGLSHATELLREAHAFGAGRCPDVRRTGVLQSLDGLEKKILSNDDGQ